MRVADAVTLIGGALAGASIALAVIGHVEYAVRMLMLSYAADVLDGWVARRFGGSTEKGLMLDRAFDRVSQVIGPLVAYAAWIRTLDPGQLYTLIYVVYAGGLVAVAFWRLIYRVVWSLRYFAGLPMFAHAAVLLSSIIAGSPIPAPILLALLAASAAPIPYVRRLSEKSTPSPGMPLRLLIVTAIALVPYDWEPIQELAWLLRAAILVYAAAGAIPPLLGLTPSPRSMTRGEGVG